MGKASPIQTTFNAGELSPRIAGRVDLVKYSNGAKVVENFLLTPQGPAVRRAGFRYVGEVKDSSKQTWLLRFEFNTTQAYVIEVGDFYMRFWANHGQVIVSGVAAYNGATTYAVGDLVSNAGINYYCIAATTGNAPPNATYWYALTGVIYEIPSPYAVADLTDTDGTFRLRFAQSGDIIYIAHPSYQPRKLSRFGATNWTLTSLANTGGPFKTQNTTATTIYSSVAGPGAATFTASAALFTASMVGQLIQLTEKDVRATPQWVAGTAYAAAAVVHSNGVNYSTAAGGTSGGVKPNHTSGSAQDGAPGVLWVYQDPGYGVAQITGYTDSTHVSVNILSRIPDLAVGAGNATDNWALGAWNSTDGFPSQVTFFRERLTFGGSGGQYIDMSVSGDYENFDTRDPLGQIGADRAIRIQVVARKVNKIVWMDAGADLLIGTAGGEFRGSEMTQNQVFGPGNVTVRPQSEYGGRAVASQRLGNSILYVQRSGRKVREMAFDTYSPDNYKSTDVTVLAEHIGKQVVTPSTGFTGILASDYQQEPFSMIWYVRADGVLLALTFNREQDVVGWGRHPLGGSGVAEAITIIPAPDATRNEVWTITKRTINGVTKRYVEYLETEHQDGDDIEQAFYLDCGLSYDGKVNATLTPGVGATVQHTVGVNIGAGSAIFSAGDVGRYIHYRYLASSTDANGVVTYTWRSASALITAFVTPILVVCTIDAAFPSLATIAANGWRMTATTITGLSHLEGQTVDVLTNGASHPQCVVSGGSITLQVAASVVHVGLACPARLHTMRLNAGAQDGTSQGKTARVNKLAILFHESVGCQYGPDSTALDELPFRSTGDPMDQPPPLFTGYKLVEFDGDYTYDPRVWIQNNQPFPTTVAAIAPQTHVYDR